MRGCCQIGHLSNRTRDISHRIKRKYILSHPTLSPSKRITSCLQISVFIEMIRIFSECFKVCSHSEAAVVFFSAINGLYWIQSECSHCCSCSNGAYSKWVWNLFEWLWQWYPVKVMQPLPHSMNTFILLRQKVLAAAEPCERTIIC